MPYDDLALIFFLSALGFFAIGAITACVLIFATQIKYRILIGIVAMLGLWVGGYPVGLLATSFQQVPLEVGVEDCDGLMDDASFSQFMTTAREYVATSPTADLLDQEMTIQFQLWGGCLLGLAQGAPVADRLTEQIAVREARIDVFRGELKVNGTKVKSSYTGIRSKPEYELAQAVFEAHVELLKSKNRKTDWQIVEWLLI